MPRPTVFPEWAMDDVVDPISGQPNVEEPEAATKLEGWTRHQKPPRQYFNWLGRITDLWIEYFDEVLSGTSESVEEDLSWMPYLVAAPTVIDWVKCTHRIIAGIVYVSLDIQATWDGFSILSLDLTGSALKDTLDLYPNANGKVLATTLPIMQVEVATGTIKNILTDMTQIGVNASGGYPAIPSLYFIYGPAAAYHRATKTRTIMPFTLNLKDIRA